MHLSCSLVLGRDNPRVTKEHSLTKFAEIKTRISLLFLNALRANRDLRNQKRDILLNRIIPDSISRVAFIESYHITSKEGPTALVSDPNIKSGPKSPILSLDQILTRWVVFLLLFSAISINLTRAMDSVTILLCKFAECSSICDYLVSAKINSYLDFISRRPTAPPLFRNYNSLSYLPAIVWVRMLVMGFDVVMGVYIKSVQ